MSREAEAWKLGNEIAKILDAEGVMALRIGAWTEINSLILETMERLEPTDKARDRLLINMAEALAELVKFGPFLEDKTRDQMAHNIRGSAYDLLKYSGLDHARHSQWRDLING